MSDEIRKSFSGAPIKADAKADIDLINRYTLKDLKPEEVFAFNINLCDDQPDRDNECFNLRSLRKLATMFPGKPLIQDHEWSANNQQGRIYRAQVVQDDKVNRLRASVYMVRTPGTEETITQIEGGVLKEVSIGFAIKKLTCSICGKPMNRSWGRYAKCENDHEKGKEYDGQTCLGIMEDPSDAFEVSFVAVPSQREAGVTKGRTKRKDLPPEEWEERRKLIEEVNGFKFSDAAWDAIKAGKVSCAEVSSAYQNQQAEASKPKAYNDIIPEDDLSPDSIQFALIPERVVDKGTLTATFRALGFCRKELQLQPISVKWFATIRDAKRLGLDLADLKTFHYSNVMGLASRRNPSQILVRYPQAYSGIMKTVAHELWHTFQMKDEYNPLEEDNAYWYMDDAIKRYEALSTEDQEKFFYDELLMKDYSKA